MNNATGIGALLGNAQNNSNYFGNGIRRRLWRLQEYHRDNGISLGAKIMKGGVLTGPPGTILGWTLSPISNCSKNIWGVRGMGLCFIAGVIYDLRKQMMLTEQSANFDTWRNRRIRVDIFLAFRDVCAQYGRQDLYNTILVRFGCAITRELPLNPVRYGEWVFEKIHIDAALLNPHSIWRIRLGNNVPVVDPGHHQLIAQSISQMCASLLNLNDARSLGPYQGAFIHARGDRFRQAMEDRLRGTISEEEFRKTVDELKN